MSSNLLQNEKEAKNSPDNIADSQGEYDQKSNDLSPWDRVKLARHPNRPVLQDYIEILFSEFLELHGDRFFSDDRALIGGFANLADKKVMLIGHNKGKNVEENIERNFGMARPEGYRKSLRLMKLAEKCNIPVISLVDTSGAYPGMDAEERGQAAAIAENLYQLSMLKTPTISIITGEGGSGGAIGVGACDVVLMLENSIYSVISPEGCAAILWRDSKYAPDAAEALKLTADSLYDLGVIDEIISEPEGGAHNDYMKTVSRIKKVLIKHLDILSEYSVSELLEKRFEKFSKLGSWGE